MPYTGGHFAELAVAFIHQNAREAIDGSQGGTQIVRYRIGEGFQLLVGLLQRGRALLKQFHRLPLGLLLFPQGAGHPVEGHGKLAQEVDPLVVIAGGHFLGLPSQVFQTGLQRFERIEKVHPGRHFEIDAAIGQGNGEFPQHLEIGDQQIDCLDHGGEAVIVFRKEGNGLHRLARGDGRDAQGRVLHRRAIGNHYRPPVSSWTSKRQVRSPVAQQSTSTAVKCLPVYA